ncbi:Phototropin-2 [Carex littledalei]|uniref:Phototropin-2 n=1 Tax=Carex littledalei TaxID=544730 RepID=A0A833RBM6_9POAL|nr:Phototropin-2 [Carex littledalei]
MISLRNRLSEQTELQRAKLVKATTENVDGDVRELPDLNLVRFDGNSELVADLVTGCLRNRRWSCGTTRLAGFVKCNIILYVPYKVVALAVYATRCTLGKSPFMDIHPSKRHLLL